MGTTFCKKKYIRAIQDTSLFKKGDVFEVVREVGIYYYIWGKKSLEYGIGPREWFKHRFEIIPEEETPMTLKIEVGKFYKTRGGLKAGPAERPRNTVTYSYDFVLKVDGFVKIYQSNGRNGSINIGFFPEHDLIEEWVEDNRTQVKFKVGDIVKRSNGFSPDKKLKIVDVVNPDNFTVEWLDMQFGSTHGWMASELELADTDFKVGDIIVNSHPGSSKKQKKILAVTKSHYFVEEEGTLKEHLMRIDQLETWIIAPPPPKVTKVYHNVYSSGAIGGIKYYSLGSCKTAVIDPSIIYGFLEITITDDNGKLTMESRIIPA